MAEFKTMLFGFILFSLFATCILISAVQMGGLYGRDTTAMESGALNLSRFNNSVSGISNTAEDTRERFEEKGIWSAVAGVVVTGMFDIAKSLFTMMITPFTLLADVMTNVLMIPSFVVSVLLGLMILAIIFGIWKLIKIGDA